MGGTGGEPHRHDGAQVARRPGCSSTSSVGPLPPCDPASFSFRYARDRELLTQKVTEFYGMSASLVLARWRQTLS